MHPYWQHVKKLIRKSDNAKLWSLVIGGTYVMTVQAGPPWSSKNYEPKDACYDDASSYSSYQCVIYVASCKGSLPDITSYDDAIALLVEGKMDPLRDYQFDATGIRFGTLLWDAQGGMVGRRVPKSIIEAICDDLVSQTGHVFHDVQNVCVERQVTNVKCRACGDGDRWNGPDFIGDGMYTCYRCRNHPFVALKNVPENLQDNFKSYYANIDKHTCR